MILFIILLLMLIMLTVITVFAVSVGGTVFVIVFGDVIVCGFIIVWILKHIRKRK